MATFALIHGSADVGWYWHLVERELHERGHVTVAPDLPCDDNRASLVDYADTVVDAIKALDARDDLVVVGQSYAGFTAPVVADRLGADTLVLVAAMIPAPGETPADWWENTGYRHAVEAQAARDGGLTGSDDPDVVYYHDVPRPLAREARSKACSESETAYRTRWPLDAWPSVRTKVVVCTEDRLFPAGFMRQLAAERLGLAPDDIDEIAAGHMVALSRPHDLAGLLDSYVPARPR